MSGAPGQGATPDVAPARTALVTGASRGIGRAVAVGLAASGLDVALLARDAGRLAGVADEIAALDGAGRAVVVTADVTDAGRRPGLKAAQLEAQSLQAFRQLNGWNRVVRTG